MSRTRRAAGAALALCAALTGCQFLVSQIPDGPNPVPTAPATAGETQIQRQMRLDYAAAEKAYRTSSLEADHLVASGATTPTKAFKAVATGQYLKLIMSLSKQVREAGYTSSTGSTITRGVVEAGWQEKRVELVACQDVRNVRFYKDGKRVESANQTPYYVQHLTVTETDPSTWKVSHLETTQVKTLKGQACSDT